MIRVSPQVLMAMYDAMGTQIALQYGGSQALHAPNSNAAKDFLQSVKRFYRNAFTDLEKQQIIDLFLGVYEPRRGTPHIWDLESDLFLHNHPAPSFLEPLPSPARSSTTPPGPVCDAKPAAARLFASHYEVEKLSSFDEILSRAHAIPQQARGARVSAPVAPVAGDDAGGVARTVAGPSRGAAAEALVRADEMLSEMRLESVGDLCLLLPREYVQVSEWQTRQDVARAAVDASAAYVSHLRPFV